MQHPRPRFDNLALRREPEPIFDAQGRTLERMASEIADMKLPCWDPMYAEVAFQSNPVHLACELKSKDIEEVKYRIMMLAICIFEHATAIAFLRALFEKCTAATRSTPDLSLTEALQRMFGWNTQKRQNACGEIIAAAVEIRASLMKDRRFALMYMDQADTHSWTWADANTGALQPVLRKELLLYWNDFIKAVQDRPLTDSTALIQTSNEYKHLRGGRTPLIISFDEYANLQDETPKFYHRDLDPKLEILPAMHRIMSAFARRKRSDTSSAMSRPEFLVTSPRIDSHMFAEEKSEPLEEMKSSSRGAPRQPPAFKARECFTTSVPDVDRLGIKRVDDIAKCHHISVYSEEDFGKIIMTPTQRHHNSSRRSDVRYLEVIEICLASAKSMSLPHTASLRSLAAS